MKSSKSDYQAVVELSAGRQYQFRYLIDGAAWVNDWQADAYLPTPFGVENSNQSTFNERTGENKASSGSAFPLIGLRLDF